MIRYSSLQDAASDRSRRRCPVATTGFFDGLHLGHQKLLADLQLWAAEVQGETVVITFDPHPQEVVRGSAPPAIHSLEHRLLLLERAGIDAVLILPFDLEMSQWSVEDFVQRVFLESLGCRHYLLGFDSAIGCRRQGDFDYLTAHSDALGLEVRQSEPLLIDETRISSTIVRDAILHGQLDTVRRTTNRRYSILGRVVAGDGRGKSLGFPTANLEISAEAAPPSGVYFALVDRVLPGADSEASPRDRPALVNIGRRPTFASSPGNADLEFAPFRPDRDRIEAHLLDYQGDLYGAWLEVRFLQAHRPERRFDRVSDLIEQIRIDENTFREWLSVRQEQ
jgi:riboflavin kinase/FMN adenylyltransferase